MNPFPQIYASPVHLPFNRHALGGRFELSTPDKGGSGEEGHWLVLKGTELLMTPSAQGLVWPVAQQPGFSAVRPQHPVYLGTWDGEPCYAGRLAAEAAVPDGWSLENMLGASPRLDLAQISLGGMAHQILHWEANSRFCSVCGGELQRLAGEWGKQCAKCRYSHFPHIHPCVIVLVQRRGEVLLTRKREWPEGRYSLVAGFLDFGECLEEAVSREVLEETGVRVKNVRYVGSQSWPFPSQVMAGFVAEYDGGEVQVEEKELEDARWFAVSELPVLPPKRSIARYILDTFIDPAASR